MAFTPDILSTNIISQGVGAFDSPALLEQVLESEAEAEENGFGVIGSGRATEAADQSGSRNRNKTLEKIPNPLRDYNSYNYIVTLACLSPEEYNDPLSYRNNGFSNIILRSGGGEYDRRVQTSLEVGDTNSEIPEQAFNNHAEYFIEDLEIDAVVAPNPNTRLALGTNVKFKVIEPYSMGKFIEALAIAASERNFRDYTHAPYCLRIDFVGWFHTKFKDERSLVTSSYIPVQITKLDFQNTEQGSTYEVEAVVYNDSAFYDTVNKAKTPIEACGKTVAEVLNEVTRALNSLKDDQEQEGRINGYDRHVILFPKNLDIGQQILTDSPEQPRTQERITQGGFVSGQGGDAPEQGGVAPDLGGFATVEQSETATVVQAKRQNTQTLSDRLLQFAFFSGEENEIGSSEVVKDPNQAGNSCFVPIETNAAGAEPRALASPDPEKRKFQFSQYSRITDIIEEVLKKSKYAEGFSSEKSPDGFKKFYRIISRVVLDTNAEVDASIGRYPKVYVYMVIPYLTNESRSLPPGQNPRNIQTIRSLARKEYNYFYTGKNEDVLDFKINFNNAYFNIVYSDLARSPARPGDSSVAAPRAETELAQEKAGSSGNDARPSTESTDISRSSYGGAQLSSESGHKERIAEMVHERIVNSNVDMITAEIDIWGDPYFVPSNVGNYNPPSKEYGLTVDDTVDYADKEVYIIVNFVTPFDYQIDGSLMDFPGQYTRFSGIYQVWGLTCMFSNGEFKQNLKLIRINKQTANETPDNDPTNVVVGVSSSLMTAEFNPDGTISGLGQSARPGSRPTPTPTPTSTTAGDDIVFGLPVAVASPAGTPTPSTPDFDPTTGIVLGSGQSARPGSRPSPTLSTIPGVGDGGGGGGF